MKGIGMNKFYGICAAAALVAGSMLQGCDVPFQAHTQEFGTGANNLEGLQLYFIPTPGDDSYQRMVVEITDLVNDPTGDTPADVSGGAVEVALGANAVSFFGTLYDSIFIGADGTIGMGEAGSNETLQAHFMRPQVSLLPVDVNGAPAGTVSYEVVNFDSVAVTYDGVSAGGANASAQAIFDITPAQYGDISLTYAEISMDAAGIIGLSAGYDQATIDSLLGSFGFQTPLATEVMTGTVPAAA